MPQLRKDPVTSRWVIVNVEEPRSAASFRAGPQPKSSKTCPFCPGNEGMTPPEIVAYGRRTPARNGPGWQVRVVPNKFPALRIEESTEKLGIGVYDKVGGFGAHEVIIDTPDHDREMADLPVEHVEWILRAYRDRFVDLQKDPRFKFVLIFKNYGAAAGASLEHPHSQLIGLPVVPSRVLGEVKGSAKHLEYSDRCIYCDMLAQESAEKSLGVLDEGGFVAMCPFASRFPFETWVLPKAHEPSFETLSDGSIKFLASALKKTLGKIKGALEDPPFNFMVHTTPGGSKDRDAYHWHIEIIPQLTQVAGFELGTGFYVNPTPPEEAARTLRAQAVAE
jgi:UDPglucose--hexose-1-phosphate uridylyltransferase